MLKTAFIQIQVNNKSEISLNLSIMSSHIKFSEKDILLLIIPNKALLPNSLQDNVHYFILNLICYNK